jgi:hypothetical protein
MRRFESRRMSWERNVARMGENMNAYRILVGEPEGKRLLRGQRHRWEDDIKVDLGEIGWSDMDWIDRAQDRDQWWDVVSSALKFRYQ